MRIAWIACTFASLLACPVEAQRAKHARPTEAERKIAFVVQVRDGGVLQSPSRQIQTLRQLHAGFGEAAAAFDPKAASAKRLSALPVIIEVEPNVPWHHVQVVMQVASRQRIQRIWLARRRADKVEYVNAWLGGGAGGTYVKTEKGLVELPTQRFLLYLVPQLPLARRWIGEGGTTYVVQPTAVAYRFGPNQEVGPLLKATTEATIFAARARMEIPLAPTVGVVAAAPSTPSRFVFDAMGAFASPLYSRVGILDAPLPDQGTWDRKLLPFPELTVWPKSKARVVGGDPKVQFPAVLRVAEGDATPTESDEVQAVPEFTLVDKTIRMPLGAGLASDRGPWDGDRIVINLSRRGELRSRGHQFSLRALGSFVRGFVAARALDGNKRPVRVLLRVDGDAPWQHVQALLTELHRSQIERVEFGVRAAATSGDSERDAMRFDVLYRKDEPDGQQHDAFFDLVLDEWAGTRLGRDADVVSNQIDRSELQIRAEREVESEWGPAGEQQKVRRPVLVRYDWNATGLVSFREVIRALVDARGLALKRRGLWSPRKLRVVVSASEKVPAKYPIAALARLSALKWGEIWYFRRAKTPESAREALFLPYPRSNVLLEVRDGLEGHVIAPGTGRKKDK